MSEQVFRFQYTVFEVNVRLSAERIEARQGMRTVLAPLDRIRHLYVFDGRDRSQHELLITWLTPKGRLKRARIYADHGEPGFAGLVEALVALRPDADIRGLEAHEAWAKAGAKPKEWVVLPGVMAAVTLVVGIAFTPLWVHGLDRGHAETSVEALAGGAELSSRNLTVRGQLQIDRGVVDDVGHARASAATAWFPLVDPQRPDAPVTLVGKVSGSAELDYGTLAAQPSQTGILRDVWWEGLSSHRRLAFKKAGLTLAPRVRVLHIGARPEEDLAIVLGVLGLLAVLTLGVSVVLWRRRQAPPPQKPRLAGR